MYSIGGREKLEAVSSFSMTAEASIQGQTLELVMKKSDNSKFLQDLNFDIGEEYTESKSVTGIQANINKTLALKFTYTIRHKSKVPDPATTEKTDTEAAMTLVYNF